MEQVKWDVQQDNVRQEDFIYPELIGLREIHSQCIIT